MNTSILRGFISHTRVFQRDICVRSVYKVGFFTSVAITFRGKDPFCVEVYVRESLSLEEGKKT